jgi:RNA polymerase sigma-B factor
VHVDRGLKERHATVEGAIAELSKRLGRAPSVAEISHRVGRSEEDVLEAIDVGNAHHALSIDAGAPEGDDEDRPPGRAPTARRGPATEVGVSQMQVSRILRSTLEKLRGRVRESDQP